MSAQIIRFPVERCRVVECDVPCGRHPECAAGCMGRCGKCCSHDPRECDCTRPYRKEIT